MNLNKMKVVYTPFLTILIYFIPVLVFCQSEPPLLLLSNTGAGGLEGMKLEINDQTLMNPGPSITFDAPDPMIPGNGRLMVGLGNIGLEYPRYIMENIGSTGQDGMRIKVQFPWLSKEFNNDWNVVTGTHKEFFANPVVDMIVASTFELDTPRIVEVVSSNNPLAKGTLVRSTSLSDGELRTQFGNNLNDLSVIQTFHNDPPVHQTRIQSALLPQESFFDIFYDLDAATISQTYQGLTKRYQWITINDYAWGLNSVSLPEKEFDFEYDLNTGTEKHTYSDATGSLTRQFDGLSLTGGPGNAIARRVISSNDIHHNDLTTKWNLDEMSIDESFQDLHHIQTYDPGAGILGFAVESTSFPFQKMEVKYQTLDRLIQTSVHDLHEIQTFDPEFGIFVVSRESSAPSLSERSFISEYNLTTGESIDRAVKPPGTLLPHVKRMEGSGPNVKLKYASTDPPLVDKIFEVDYNMATGTIQESFQNLRFEKQIQIESCQFGVHSTLLPNNSITTDYNLAEGSILTKHKEGGHKETIEIDSWRMGVSSDLLPDDDFEVVYDLADHACTTSFNDLDHSQTFDPVAGTLVNTIMSSNPAMLSCTNGYDLASRSISESFGTLHCTKTFDPDLHKVVQTFESEGPMVASLDIEYILAEEVITSRRLHHFQNQFDVDLTDEFNVASRIFTEACTDGTNTLTVARQLDTPIGPTFAIGGNLSIESGSTISSTGGAPLLLTGPVVVDGIQTITGSLDIAGDLNVTGTKNFKIDHPLDPDNKYLIHSCIESPDMMNIYNGNATTDENGYVTIQLPDYFEALNNDFRYQLTCMGQFAQAIVDQKIKDNTFIIRTDKPNVEVSWQVTGIRHDPASRRNSFAVEVEKEAEMKGKRLYNK